MTVKWKRTRFVQGSFANVVAITDVIDLPEGEKAPDGYTKVGPEGAENEVRVSSADEAAAAGVVL